MTTRLATYLSVWRITAQNALQIAFVHRGSNVFFMLGKVLRFAMTLFFLLLLKQQHVVVAGYTTDQVIMFFLTYQLVDTLAQVFFRGVYEFGQVIRSGEFDAYLNKPISALFRVLTGKPDLNDALFFIPSTVFTFYLMATLPLSISLTSLTLYLCLLVNSFLIATGMHVLVVTFGVLTTEVDNLIWTYRDVTRLGQFPVSLYVQPLRTILFFIIPVGLMFTVPAQVLLGVSPTVSVPISFIIGMSFFIITLRIWKWGLRHYSSASS